MLRPVIEFCNVVYNPMLTVELSEKLKRLQKRSSKIIYSFEIPYTELLSMSGIQSLKDRREIACIKFANGLARSQRYGDIWFPENVQNVNQSLRNKKKYKEFYARTSRLYNSPLYSMRRILNNANDNSM